MGTKNSKKQRPRNIKQNSKSLPCLVVSKVLKKQICWENMGYMGKQGLVGTNGEVGQIPEKGGN